MKRLRLFFLVLFGIFAIPQFAQANAGTPLMWAGMLHLFFGNALIGLGEGLLLGWLFSLPKLKSVLVMVAANYFSAWAGLICIISPVVQMLPLDLDNAWQWFWRMVGVTYCLTLILEWPFVAFCFSRTERWLKRSLLASLVVQTASYGLLFGWYAMASGTSLYTEMNIVEPAEMSLPETVVVYYINPTDGNVYRRPLVGGVEKKIFDLHSTGGRLFFRPNKTDAARWDLIARCMTSDYKNPRFVDILTDQRVETPVNKRDKLDKEHGNEGSWFSMVGEAPKLGDAAESSWTFVSGLWPLQGLRAENSKTGVFVRFAYETPFGEWYIRNAVHLPTDKVLFLLGKDQICVFDPATRQVALLWRGQGPTAVVEKEDAGKSGKAP